MVRQSRRSVTRPLRFTIRAEEQPFADSLPAVISSRPEPERNSLWRLGFAGDPERPDPGWGA